jgi:uncharacterized repeat protein (TIGR02543 family)
MFGQIGDSGGDGSNSPVVVALPPGMSASRVATGYGHTCATVNAGVYCWGSNYNGQIGSGIDSASVAPTPVSAIEPDSGATDVSLGEAHSCALISGAVQCWGDNDLGQLGNGTKQTAKLAVPVSLLGANVTGISAGGFFTCAVVGGGVKCWGTGEEGQLGYDADSNLPIDASSFGLALTQKFKVTYVAPGIKSQLPTQADVEEGTTFELAGAPVRSGYKFAGWSDGTQVYAAGATYPADSVTGDLQLTATWTSIKPTTNKKLTYNVVGFAAGTSKLTKSMMLTLNAVAKFASSGAQVTCTGYTGGPSVLAIDKYIALNRATVVCNYLAKKNPKLANFKVKTVNTKIVSSDQRKTVVTLSK